MAVQERYAFAIPGPEEGLAIASRLAAFGGARLRWVATWTDAPGRSDAIERIGSGSERLSRASEAGLEVVWLAGPSIEEVRELVAHAGRDPLCVHWSPRTYRSEEGPDAPWIAFVDASGVERDDARIYRIELALDAVPLTTADRPWQRDFVLGPTPADGWGLRASVVRDHMPRAQLVARLAAVAGVPRRAVEPVAG